MAIVTVGWTYTAHSDVDRILLCRATTLDKESTFELYLNENIGEPFLTVIHDEPASNYVDGQSYTFVDYTANDDELYFYCIAVKAAGPLGLYKVGAAAAASDDMVTLSTPLGTSAVNRILTEANSGGTGGGTGGGGPYPENTLPLYCSTQWEAYRAFGGYDEYGNEAPFISSGMNGQRYIAYSQRIGIPDVGGAAARPVPGILVEVSWMYNTQNPRTPFNYYTNYNNTLETAVFPLVNTNIASGKATFKVRCSWRLFEITDTYVEYILYAVGYSAVTVSSSTPKSRIVVDPDDPTKNMFVGYSDSDITEVTYRFNSWHAPTSWSDVGFATTETSFDSARKYMTNYEQADLIAEPDSPSAMDIYDGAVPYHRSLFTGAWSGDTQEGNYIDPRGDRRTYGVWSDDQGAGIQVPNDLRTFTVTGNTIHPCND